MRSMLFKIDRRPVLSSPSSSPLALAWLPRPNRSCPRRAGFHRGLQVPRPSRNQSGGDDRLEQLRQEVLAGVDDRRGFIQRMVDTQFSFGELGFQEFETQRYLTGILEREGFEIELGTAGMPSAWLARWGSGRPVIALGSDVDGIPRSSQVPGVAYRQPQIEGAPSHGEGHNSGQAVNIAAALAVKEIMEREGIPARS